jgi:hypothetical protein
VEEIIVDIDVQGNVRVEGKGIKGSDCVKLTKDLEDALGDVEKKTLTSEYHQARAIARKAGG